MSSFRSTGENTRQTDRRMRYVPSDDPGLGFGFGLGDGPGLPTLHVKSRRLLLLRGRLLPDSLPAFLNEVLCAPHVFLKVRDSTHQQKNRRGHMSPKKCQRASGGAIMSTSFFGMSLTSVTVKDFL